MRVMAWPGHMLEISRNQPSKGEKSIVSNVAVTTERGRETESGDGGGIEIVEKEVYNLG